MKTRLLTTDRNALILYNAEKTDSFAFNTASELREFTKRYYHNPIAAIFAHKCCNPGRE